MSEPLTSLWPTGFDTKVLPPLVILKAQADYLPSVTSGILKATVETTPGKTDTEHRLTLVAPAAGGYRHVLVTVTHKTDYVYPAEVRAEPLAEREERRRPPNPLDSTSILGGGLYTSITYPSAGSDKELTNLLSNVFRSTYARGIINGLIAKSNEATAGKTFSAEANGPSAETTDDSSQ